MTERKIKLDQKAAVANSKKVKMETGLLDIEQRKNLLLARKELKDAGIAGSDID